MQRALAIVTPLCSWLRACAGTACTLSFGRIHLPVWYFWPRTRTWRTWWARTCARVSWRSHDAAEPAERSRSIARSSTMTTGTRWVAVQSQEARTQLSLQPFNFSVYYRHCLQSMRSWVYETVRCPSVCLSTGPQQKNHCCRFDQDQTSHSFVQGVPGAESAWRDGVAVTSLYVPTN